MLVFLSTDLAFWGERAKANPISVSEHRACPTMIKISATLNIRLYQQNLILVVMFRFLSNLISKFVQPSCYFDMQTVN